MANQEKLKTLIDKINWLYKSFEENDFKNISSLEKALIKEKILMFYDEIENLETKIHKERFPKITAEKIVSSTVEKPMDEVEKDKEPEITVSSIKNKELEAQSPVFVETVVEENSITEIAENTKETDETAIPSEAEWLKEEVEEKEVSTIAELVEEVVEEIEESLIPSEAEEIIEPIVEEAKKAEDAQAKADLKREKFEKTLEFQRQIAMPKRDIREIIDLNKSFIFKAELFNQNNDIYNQFINEINSTRTEDEALSFMVDWTEKMKWKTEENKAYDLLLRAIEKRFLPLI